MTILDQLTSLMLEKVEVTPVPKQELDDFLSQNNIDICDEHYQFLLNYGNSEFLNQHYAYLVFDSFKWYYTTDDFLDDMVLPKFCEYLGTDFMSEAICLDYIDKKIYSFDYGEKYEKPYYGGLKELLFFYLFKLIIEKKYFDKIEENIKIDDVEKFKSDYLNYEIKDIYLYNRYFFKDNKLIICDDKFHYYSIYYGGILDKIIDDR
ncbi:hypothetical protein M2R47_09270 [Moraxella sp. Tifton1]|uniref:hypothetical protein n=1 Tax=Moraxella oculi TaxID=2940516 RepID=UPI002012B223|nr:hypothetical protein [Moraxella sp. Tifton1]MCL1624416.1 hypothetical protein [Moraxella sp. Tifton1]